VDPSGRGELGNHPMKTFKEILTASAAKSDTSFPIVAFGSSIVEVYMGCGGYHNWIDLISNTIRFSFGKNIVVINQGIGGNTIVDLNSRISRDVISFKPVATIVAIGGNCAKVPIPLDKWIENFELLILTLKRHRIYPVVCTYFYQDFERLPLHFSVYNDYRKYMAESAEELGFEFVDIFRSFEILSKKIPNYREEILRNELHVNPVGNALMSYVFCKLVDIPLPAYSDSIGPKVEEFAARIGI